MTTDLTVLTVVVPLLAGLAGGFVNAVAGGGTLLVFPALIWLGYDPITANVTNTVSLWPGYLSSVAAMRHDLVGRKALLRPLMLSSGVAALAGSTLLLRMPAASFEVAVPFLILFASLLLLLGPVLSGRSGQDDVATARPWWLLPAVVGAGIYGGYFGGVVGVLLLAIIGLSGIVTGSAIPAVKNLLQLTINTVALVVFVLSGEVAWFAVALLAPMTLVGGWIGGRVASRLRPSVLRTTVGVFGLAVAGYLLLR